MEAELAALRRSVERGIPHGSEAWVAQTAKQLGLESSLHRLARPRKRAKRGAPGGEHDYSMKKHPECPHSRWICNVLGQRPRAGVTIERPREAAENEG
jgi:hypothetical protein